MLKMGLGIETRFPVPENIMVDTEFNRTEHFSTTSAVTFSISRMFPSVKVNWRYGHVMASKFL